ncbi:TPA: hypothetical protein ACGFX1_000882 [Vibrio cholerae]
MNKKVYNAKNYINALALLVLTGAPRFSHGEPTVILDGGTPNKVNKVRISPETVVTSGFLQSSAYNSNKVWVNLYYNDSTVGSTHECNLGDFQTTNSASNVASNPALRQQYALEITQAAENCFSFSGTLLSNNIRHWDLLVSDGHKKLNDKAYSGWGLRNIPFIPERPVSCSAFLPYGLEFGSIHVGETKIPTTTTHLEVKCDSPTTITTSVNNNTNLVNEDGSVIAFEYVQQSNILNEESTKIMIRGSMVNLPRFPGSYKWYTAVNVNYE